MSKDKNDLISTLNRINVLSWESNYFNPTVMDGTSWKLKIRYNGTRKFYSEGLNYYPGSKDYSMEETGFYRISERAEKAVEC